MMNNKRRESGKVIPFPGLENRLYEKGITHIKNEEYEHAYECLHDALEIDPYNTRVEFALLTNVIAAFDHKEYELVTLLAEDVLQRGIGDYFEVLDMYLMSLIQLKQHKKVVEQLKVLLAEQELPDEQRKHFQSLKSLSEKIYQSQEFVKSKSNVTVEDFKTGNVQEHTVLIGSWKDLNIQPYLDVVKDLLKDSEIHPFLQTIALNVLREHAYEKEVIVNKFSQEKYIRPSELTEIDDLESFLQITSMLEKRLLDENPTLLEQLMMMVHRHFFLAYPLTMEEYRPEVIALVYQKIGYGFYGMEFDEYAHCAESGIELKQFEEAYHFIMQIEMASSLIN